MAKKFDEPAGPNENSLICQNCKHFSGVTKPQYPYAWHVGDCAHYPNMHFINTHLCSKFEGIYQNLYNS